MNCQECQDLLPLYATGSLDPAEAMAVRAHLATGCPECAAELAATEATLHKVPGGLPLRAAPASAWDKLETRIALKEQAEGSADGTGAAADRAALSAPFKRGRPSLLAWTGWAAAAVVAIVLGQAWLSFDTQNQIQREQIARLKQLSETNLQALSKVVEANQQMLAQNKLLNDEIVQRQDRLESLLRSDSFAVTSPTQPNASGKLYWDKTSQTWQIYLGGVKAAAPGKTYELWIVTANDKLAAGTAQVDDKGRLFFQTSRKFPDVPLLAAAITDENAAGEPDNGAKGSVQFLAKLN